MRRIGWYSTAVTAWLVCAGSSGLAAVGDPLDRPALQTRAAAHSVLLGVAKAGSRLVAVGERGIIVLSDDGGKSWRQARVPTSISLTAVSFPAPKLGWAIGHAGVVLHTEDGGETWTRQLDGKTAAKLALDAAQAAIARSPKDTKAQAGLAEAERLVADGPDKPFLDLAFESETTGFVVGAYNLICRTEDGGKSWQPWLDRLDNPKGLHLYAVKTFGKNIYLAGEQGLFLRSLDEGKTFQRLQTPYAGTYFSIAVAPGGEIVLAGLRGNAYRSGDRGKTFTKVEVPIPVSFSAAITLTDGRLLFANQAGQLLESRDQGRTMQPLAVGQLPPIAGLTQVNEGLVVAAGIAGAIPIPVPGAGSAGSVEGVR